MAYPPRSPSVHASADKIADKKLSQASPKSDIPLKSKSKSSSKPTSVLEQSAISPALSARLPPPSLFQGPPSRNSSSLSLHLPGISAAAIGLPASVTASPSISPHEPLTSSRSRPPRRDGIEFQALDTGAAASSKTKGDLKPLLGRRPTSTFSRQTTDANAKSENDRADAQWDEMQNTLAEVEVSAANGSQIFGEGHARALEELRMAQLALAKAWVRSEKDEIGSQVERDRGTEGGSGAVGLEGEEPPANGPTKPRSDGKGGTRARPLPASTEPETHEEKRGKTLEEETEYDILLAKERREANDKYFEQVNNAVVDVVAKLDEVAGAMRRVEKESRDIWSDEEEDQDGSESISESTGDR